MYNAPEVYAFSHKAGCV